MPSQNKIIACSSVARIFRATGMHQNVEAIVQGNVWHHLKMIVDAAFVYR